MPSRIQTVSRRSCDQKEVKFVLVPGERGGNVRREEQRRDLTDHGTECTSETTCCNKAAPLERLLWQGYSAQKQRHLSDPPHKQRQLVWATAKPVSLESESPTLHVG
jgi:hypothetical protein